MMQYLSLVLNSSKSGSPQSKRPQSMQGGGEWMHRYELGHFPVLVFLELSPWHDAPANTMRDANVFH